MFAITHAQNRACTVVMLWQNAVHLLNLDPMVIILIAQEIQIFREKKMMDRIECPVKSW